MIGDANNVSPLKACASIPDRGRSLPHCGPEIFYGVTIAFASAAHRRAPGTWANKRRAGCRAGRELIPVLQITAAGLARIYSISHNDVWPERPGRLASVGKRPSGNCPPEAIRISESNPMPFPPERTLFVAKSWPSGAGPQEFTTIGAALTKAGTLTPVEGNPVAIIIFPGTYTEKDANDVPVPLDLASWVFLSSASSHQNAVTINGDVRWILSDSSNTFEVVQLYFLNIFGTTTVNTTAKLPAEPPRTAKSGQTSFILNGCFLNGGLRVQGRSATE